MFVTIINDCRDANAAGRQGTRVAAHLGVAPVFVGVASDLEAAGNLVDTLDAAQGKRGAVLVNVAPRNGLGKKWGNGTPFGHFKYKDTHVLATIDGLTLSLIKKFGLANDIKVIDMPGALQALQAAGLTDKGDSDYIHSSQFRSYDFLPRAAAHILVGGELPGELLDNKDMADVPAMIWWVDNFGNAKTTLIKDDIAISSDGMVQTAFGELPFFNRLKDVPDGQAGIIEGSSGLGQKRFMEIVVQNVDGSARRKFGLKNGDMVF